MYACMHEKGACFRGQFVYCSEYTLPDPIYVDISIRLATGGHSAGKASISGY